MASALRGFEIRKDYSETLKKTKTNILIITSDTDTVLDKKDSYLMNQYAVNSKLFEIPQCGHLASLEKPDVWSGHILDFFGKPIPSLFLN